MEDSDSSAEDYRAGGAQRGLGGGRGSGQSGYQNVSMTGTISGEPRASCVVPLVRKQGRVLL